MSERIHCLTYSNVQIFVSVSFYEGISLYVVAFTARLHGHTMAYQRYIVFAVRGKHE